MLALGQELKTEILVKPKAEEVLWFVEYSVLWQWPS
jgi:hypothetical protein